MSWFEVLALAPLEFLAASLLFFSVAQLIKSAKDVRTGIALPLLHLFTAGVIAAAIYQIKETSFGLAAASLALAAICLMLMAKARHQSQLMRSLLDRKAAAEETQVKLVQFYGVLCAGAAMSMALLSMDTYLTVLFAVTAGVLFEFGVTAMLYLRSRRHGVRA